MMRAPYNAAHSHLPIHGNSHYSTQSFDNMMPSSHGNTASDSHYSNQGSGSHQGTQDDSIPARDGVTAREDGVAQFSNEEVDDREFYNTMSDFIDNFELWARDL